MTAGHEPSRPFEPTVLLALVASEKGRQDPSLTKFVGGNSHECPWDG